jgi:hypothetical protein
MTGFRGAGPNSGDLKRLLADDCERVVETILPDCSREGSELRGHDRSGTLWVTETRGRKRGISLCTACPDNSGDLLDLVTHALFDGSRSAAYRWALRFLGAAANRPVPGDLRPRDSRKLAEADDVKREWEKYRQAQPLVGSPAEAFLKGLRLGPDTIACPTPLRFAPRCLYGKDEATDRWIHRPAMLAPVVNPISGDFISLHCTYLEEHGGTWRKVSSKPTRKCWGSCAGGVIPLLRGASGTPLRKAPTGDGCVIGEGIENSLSGSFVRPELRVLAAISAGNLAKIALPPQIGLVVLVVDDDGEKTSLDEARERAINRWRQEGRTVEQMIPTRGYKDLNDQLQNELQH